jgi:hypothetical protein
MQPPVPGRYQVIDESRLDRRAGIEDGVQQLFPGLVVDSGEIRSDSPAPLLRKVTAGAGFFECELSPRCVSSQIERVLVTGDNLRPILSWALQKIVRDRRDRRIRIFDQPVSGRHIERRGGNLPMVEGIEQKHRKIPRAQQSRQRIRASLRRVGTPVRKQ